MNLLGIDLGIRKIAIAAFDKGVLVDAASFVSVAEDRAFQLRELSLIAQSLAILHHAEAAWIEDTLVGNNRKYSLQLTELKGAVMSSLFTLDVRTVNVQTWKREVVGNAHASKDQVRDYIHVTHGAYAPLCGDDQDRYDATCIGLYGLLITERARGLQLQPG